MPPLHSMLDSCSRNDAGLLRGAILKVSIYIQPLFLASYQGFIVTTPSLQQDRRVKFPICLTINPLVGEVPQMMLTLFNPYFGTQWPEERWHPGQKSRHRRYVGTHNSYTPRV